MTAHLKKPGQPGYHFDWIRVVRDDATLSSNAKHVAGVLQGYFDDRWATYAVSRVELMLDISAGSEDLVTRYTGELMKAGYLRKRFGSRTAGTTRYWGIMPESLPARTIKRLERKGVCGDSLDGGRESVETPDMPLGVSVETAREPVQTAITIREQPVPNQPVKATQTSPRRPAKGNQARKASVEEVAAWLNAVFRQLHFDALEAFEHDWAVKLVDQPGKREQLIKAVQSISDRPAALERLRAVILGDWDIHSWPDFAKRRKTERMIIPEPDGTMYETVRCTWNNVAQLMLDRIYDELPNLRRYPVPGRATSAKNPSGPARSFDIDALAASLANKTRNAKPA